MAKEEELVLNIKSNAGQVVKDVDKLGVAAKKSKTGFKGIGTAIKGVGTALKAAGIGLIVALLAKLMEVFSSNQKVVDAFQTGMNALSIAFNDFFSFLNDNVGKVTGYFKAIFEDPQKSLKEFGDMIQNNLIERFNSLVETFGFVGQALSALFSGNFKEAGRLAKEAGKELVDVATGVDDSFDKTVDIVTKAGDAIVDYGKKTLNTAKALTQAEKAAKMAQAEFDKLNAQFLKQAEDQRQIRDNVNNTFKERIAANKELSRLQTEQQEKQTASLKIITDAAQKRFNITKNDEDRLVLLQAQTAELQLEEAINGQISEQKTNQIGLENELLEAQKELALVGLKDEDLELAVLEQEYHRKLELARKAGEKTLEIENEYADKIAEVTKARTDKEIGFEQAKKQMQVEMANQAVQLIGMAAGEGTALAKAAAIAQATISGVQGVQNAFTAANANIGATAGSFGVYPVTMAALAGGFAAMNIAKIAQGSPPGPADAPPPPPPATPSPQMMSGKFQLGGGIKPEPLKAFVVTDEMTNSQDQLANIRRRATI